MNAAGSAWAVSGKLFGVRCSLFVCRASLQDGGWRRRLAQTPYNCGVQGLDDYQFDRTTNYRPTVRPWRLIYATDFADLHRPDRSRKRVLLATDVQDAHRCWRDVERAVSRIGLTSQYGDSHRCESVCICGKKTPFTLLRKAAQSAAEQRLLAVSGWLLAESGKRITNS